MPTSPVSLWVALSAGLLSFFTPCVLPMVPVYLLYLSGTAAGGATGGATGGSRWRTVTHAAFFVVGFGLIFVLGGVGAGMLGRLMPRVIGYVVSVGGLLLIVLGLQMAGLISLPFLNVERRLEIRGGRSGYWRSFLVGLVFAAGWTPCIGPVLASIFSLAAVSQTAASGALLLGAYSAGIAVPFLAVAALSEAALPLLGRLNRYTPIVSRVGGVFLILMGFLLVTGYYQELMFWLNAQTARLG